MLSLNNPLILSFIFLSGFMSPATSSEMRLSNYEGSSDLVNLEYHMGPVLSSPSINVYIIWYGNWNPHHQDTIRDFIHSLSPYSYPSHPVFPSVVDWWQTVRLYTDQTGSNVTGDVSLAGESYDWRYSHGKSLSRLTMQSVIKNALKGREALPLDTSRGLYMVLTSWDVQVQDFCRAVCGFHYFTFPSVVGVTLPFAWVGYSGTQCPGLCAYPFAPPVSHQRHYTHSVNDNSEISLFRAPNGDPGVDGMISVMAHELAEASTDPFVNAWYAGDDPTAPTEIADLCVGVYGTGGGGSGYVGSVYKDKWGRGYNVYGVRGRRFLIQWVWDPEKKRCFGPNAMD